MRSVKVALAGLLSATMLFGASAALAAEWRLTEVTGRVRVAVPGQTPASGAPNQAIPVGADITTAAGGRAVLTNGAQRIVVGPNSRMTVAHAEGAGMTRIMQDLGSILFQVDKQARPHFRVDTPLLAAVVKGTTFTVAVGATSDTVHVAEGLVEVRANGGGGPQDIPAGVTGRVMRDGPAQVGVIAPAATPAPAEAAQVLPPLDYSQVSDGVVAGPSAPRGLDMARNSAAPQGQGPLADTSDVASVSVANGDSSAASMVAARTSVAAISQAPTQLASSGDAPPASAGPPSTGNGGGPADPSPGNPAAGDGVGPGNGGGPPGPDAPGSGPGNGNGDNPGVNNGAGSGNSDGPAGPPAPGGGPGNGNGPGANNGVGNGNGPPGPPGSGDGNGGGPPASPGPGNGNGNGNANGPGANNGNGGGPPAAGGGPGNGDGPGADNGVGNGNGGGPPAPGGGPGNGNGNGNGPGASDGPGASGNTPGVGKGGKGKAG